MPTVKLLTKNKKPQRNSNYTEEKLLRRKAYNSTKWQKARLEHVKNHPLCEQCLRAGKIFAGTDDNPIQVHHIESPFKDGEINWFLLLDDNNLETICSYHHGVEHDRQRHPEHQSPQDIINALDDLMKDVED